MISVFEESSLLYTYKNYKVKDLSKSIRNKCCASQLGTQVYDTERAKICSKSWFYCKRNYAVFHLTSEVRTSWLKLSISNLKVLQVHKAKSNQKHGCLCTLLASREKRRENNAGGNRDHTFYFTALNNTDNTF